MEISSRTSGRQSDSKENSNRMKKKMKHRMCTVTMKDQHTLEAFCVVLQLNNCIYVIIYVYIGTGIQAILRFCLSSLNGCNVGITDVKAL
jgi:hypothetical protein